MTMCTLELIVPVSALIDMGAAAERAHHSFSPTLLGNKVAATLVIIKMIDEGNK